MSYFLKLTSFAILFGFSNQAYAAETKSDLNLQCVIAPDNEEMGYAKKLYDDIFVVELRSNPSDRNQILWMRKHPGASDYSERETIRGCAFAKWEISTQNERSIFEVSCDNDGADGHLMLDAKTLKGELSFYYPQLGYSERSVFAVDCKRQ